MAEDRFSEYGVTTGPISGAILKLLGGGKGAGGAYFPLANRVVAGPDVEEDGYIPFTGQNVITHELEHKRQFNEPGDYTSERVLKMLENSAIGKALLAKGYSRKELGYEAMAHMAGANASEKDFRTQAQWPHPAWSGLSDEQKLWYLKNAEGASTNQDYLANMSRLGEGGAGAIERLKQLAKGLLP